MAKPIPSREEILQQDREDLQRLGYTQQLFREMGGFSNFAISFSIISILTGAVLLFGYGLKFAGPVINSVGWPLASLFTLCVAASMAEIASAYPTAGGLYFWAFRFGGKTWAWATAWMNMIGQLTATAAINIAAATYIIGAVTTMLHLPSDYKVPVFGSLTNWYFQVFVMALLLIPQALINAFGIRLTAKLNNASVYWHLIGGAVIVALLTFMGKHHNSFGFLFQYTNSVTPLDASSTQLATGITAPALVFGEFKIESPLFALFPFLKSLYSTAPLFLVFTLGLLQAQWTYTGYDASAHVAEETVMARKNSAWGIFLSVLVSAVAGYILLLVLTWCIPNGDIAKTATDAYPVLYIATQNLSEFGANVVAVTIGGAMWLCGSSSIASMSRMWYAFARDDGMPGSARLKQIHSRYQTPMSAIVITSILTVVICLYAAAFTVITSISTITLYLAYVFPVYLNWRNKRRKTGEFTTPETSPWNLGKWGKPLNLIAVVWVVFITILFSLPPNELVLWTMVLLSVFLMGYWNLFAKRYFTGPTPADEIALHGAEEGGYSPRA
jgi:amino acid transporter